MWRYECARHKIDAVNREVGGVFANRFPVEGKTVCTLLNTRHCTFTQTGGTFSISTMALYLGNPEMPCHPVQALVSKGGVTP
jgi:hypothetical protein